MTEDITAGVSSTLYTSASGFLPPLNEVKCTEGGGGILIMLDADLYFGGKYLNPSSLLGQKTDEVVYFEQLHHLRAFMSFKE